MEQTSAEQATREAARIVIRNAFAAAADVLTPEKTFTYALGQVSGIHCALSAMFQALTPEREAAWEEFQAQRESYMDKHYPETMMDKEH